MTIDKQYLLMKPPVEVRFYSSHRRSVFPRALVIDGKEHLVQGIVRHEVREDFKTRRREHYFVVSVQKQLWEIRHFSDDTVVCRKMAQS